MRLEKVNDFFGLSLSVVGFSKVLLIVLVFVTSGTAATALVTGGTAKTTDLSGFSATLGILQLILAACSIIMVFVNLKSFPDASVGYLIGLAAVGLELILPSIIYFCYVFVECALYFKAGKKIRNKNGSLFSVSETKSNKEKMESTDWFYNDK